MKVNNLKIISGEAEVVSTGIFVPFEEGIMTLSFNLFKEKFTLKIERTSDKKNTDSRWVANFDDKYPTTINLSLINVSDEFGGGSVEPIPLWDSPKYKIYLQLRILSFMGLTAPYLYTIYMKKKEKSND